MQYSRLNPQGSQLQPVLQYYGLLNVTDIVNLMELPMERK